MNDMSREISVCHVVNSVGDTSMPGDIATKQTTNESIGDVGILAWFGADWFFEDDLIDVSVLDVPSGQYRISREQYRRARRILSKFDVVHTHHPHSGFYGKLLARRMRKPVITTEHNNHGGYTRLGRFANGLTNLLVDSVVCVSSSVKDSFRTWERVLVDENALSVVSNGVNLDRIESAKITDWSVHDAARIDHEAILVGSAGALVEQKSHDVLIDAVDRVNEMDGPLMELVISGDGDRRHELEEQIEKADNPDRLHLLGFLETREHVYRMMDEIDVYSMPSRWEGLCVAAIEAMALGNPCVFSDIEAFTGPFHDIALFHPVGDASGLANELIELAENPGARETLGKRAKNEVRTRYSLSETADEYVDIYQSLINLPDQ